jgi:hypothetical protein
MSSSKGKEEIGVTPEMIEAGMRAWRYLDFDDDLEVRLAEIYDAMERTRRISRPIQKRTIY